MTRLLSIASILGFVAVVVPACQGNVDSTSSQGSGASSSQGSGASSPSGCAPPCCLDDPQFPLQSGDGCVQCFTDSDCMNLAFDSAYGLKCQPNGMCGCAVDNDCVGDAVYPLCRTADATCVQCLSDADCDTTCDTTYGSCTACAVDADCKNSVHGTHCAAPACQCTSDTECAASPAGPTCLGLGQATASPTCGCTADADCSGSAYGHACPSGVAQCGCNVDADCDTGSSCQTTAHRCLPAK